jgi:hypothetical protein
MDMSRQLWRFSGIFNRNITLDNFLVFLVIQACHQLLQPVVATFLITYCISSSILYTKESLNSYKGYKYFSRWQEFKILNNNLAIKISLKNYVSSQKGFVANELKAL